MKKAIIIGASSGIGKGLSEIMVQNGYVLGIAGRRTELLEEIQSKYPESIIIKTIDITDLEHTVDLLEELALSVGRVELIILCSGTGHRNPKLDFEVEHPAIDTNVIGFTNVIDWAYRYLYEHECGGHIVAISSVAGLRGSRFAPGYSASKAYQSNYLEGVRQYSRHAKTNIHVTDVRPGFVDTAMAQGDGIFWVASVEKAARQIFRAIRSKKRVAYITKRWQMVAILMKFVPKWIYERF